MLKSLLTIIIPCKNCVMELKRTIESLPNKTKISGIRVLIPDFGSVDGSIQYAAQASSEYSKFIRIESIEMKEGKDLKDLSETVNTPYVLIINPGSTFSDRDIILNSINKISGSRDILVYLKRTNIINRFIVSLLKDKRKINAIFSNKSILEDTIFNHSDTNPEIDIDKKSMSSPGIKIAGFSDN